MKRDRRSRLHWEKLEERRLLAVDFPTPLATPWTGNLVYQSQLTAELLTTEPLELAIGLKAGQLASFSVETANASDLTATATLIGPDGNEVPARVAAVTTSRLEASTSAIDATGTYTLRIDSQSDQNVDVQAVAFVNQVFESEVGDSVNDLPDQAMSLDPLFTKISAGLSDEIVNVLGNLNDAELMQVGDDFESGELSEAWGTASTFEAGRVYVAERIDGLSLVMDTTATDPNGLSVPVDVVVDYDPATGRFTARAPDTPFTTLEITSKSGIFTGTQPDVISEEFFNVYRPDKMFVLKMEGFSDIDFGPSVATGLTAEFLVSDLEFNGSLLGGGSITVLPAWMLEDHTPNERAGVVINEAVWKVPLAGLFSPVLKFDYRPGDGNLEVPMPASFQGQALGTGVSVSADGQSWRTIASLASCGRELCSFSGNIGSRIEDLDLNADKDLWIKFQNSTIGAELVIDNLSMESIQASDWYEFHLEDSSSAAINIDTPSHRLDRTLNVYDDDGALIFAGLIVSRETMRIANGNTDGSADRFLVELVGAGDYHLNINRGDGYAITHFRDDSSVLDTNGLGRFLVAADGELGDNAITYEAEFEDLTAAGLTLRATVPDIAFSTSDLPPTVGVQDSVGVGEATADIDGNYDIDIWVEHEAEYFVLDAQFEDVDFDNQQSWIFVDRSDGPIEEFELRLGRIVDRRTLDASDLVWNGPEISSIDVEYGRFVHVHFSEPIQPGEYELSIVPESMRDPMGRFIAPVTHQLDLLPPEIELKSISDGDVLPRGETSFVMRFDSELHNFYPHGSISLTGPNGKRPLDRDNFQFSRASRFVALPLGDLQPGEYRLSFSRWQFTDLQQNRTVDPGFSINFEVIDPDPPEANLRSLDLDGDGVVDAHDLALLQVASRWRQPLMSFDLDGNGAVDVSDVGVLVRSLGSRFGDTNLDGRFDSSDLVQIFMNGTFGRRATWESGDFSGDGFFDSEDLVLAFQHGSYTALDPALVAAALESLSL